RAGRGPQRTARQPLWLAGWWGFPGAGLASAGDGGPGPAAGWRRQRARAARDDDRRAAGGSGIRLAAADAVGGGATGGSQRRPVRLVPGVPWWLRPVRRRGTSAVRRGPRSVGGP